MAEYPPYVNAYNGIPLLFEKIKAASVPTKFTVDFLSTALEMRSSSYRALIPLLKKLGFIDPANVPTQAYREYREDELSGSVMATQLKQAYKELFQSNEYAWKLTKDQLTGKFKSLTGAGDDDPYIPSIVGTFMALSKLAKWEGVAPRKRKEEEEKPADNGIGDDARGKPPKEFAEGKLGLSYTINLNLPATTEIEVFNAIFKSLRENLLRES